MVTLEPQVFMQCSGSFSPRVRENIGEMSRLINAALVDRAFCDLLLKQPELALKQGYNGERFALSEIEKSFVFSVQADSLADFAKRWSKCSRDLLSTAEFMDLLLPNRKPDC